MIQKIFKKPISFLIIFSYSLIILASFAISGIVIYYILYQQLDRNLGKNLTGLSQTVSNFIPGEWLPLLKRQNKDMVRKLALIRSQNNLRNIVVIDKNGTVVLSLDSTVV